MSTPQTDFTVLMDRLLAGSEEVAAGLVERFAPLLKQVIRQNLDARVRPALDSTDVEQQVWASFFGLQLYRTIEDPARLEDFLRSIARLKARMASRNHLRNRRDRRREVPLDEEGGETGLSSNLPGPETMAEQQEEWHRILAQLPKNRRTILEMLRDRHSLGEIANRLGISVRTVTRVIASVRQSQEKAVRSSRA